jgi:hypothetical protein
MDSSACFALMNLDKREVFSKYFAQLPEEDRGLTYPTSPSPEELEVCPPCSISYQRDNTDNTVFPMVCAAVLPLFRLLY